VDKENIMRKLNVLILLLLLGLAGSLTAHTVTVGEITGTTSSFPVYTRPYDGYTQQLYQRSLINYSGNVSKIRFFHDRCGNSSFEGGQYWAIYMGHTTRDCFASRTDWEPIGNLTQVFAGTIPTHLLPLAGEWMEISLDTPFFYNNTDNLLIAIHAMFPGNQSSVYWGRIDTGVGSGLYFGSSTINPDLTDPPIANWLETRIAALQLVFPDTQAPQAPVLVYPEDNTALFNGHYLKWQLPQGSADADGYDLYIDENLVSENQVPNRYIFNDLTPGTHTWRVVAHNAIGTSPTSETGTFEVIAGAQIGSGYQDYPLPAGEWSYTYSQTIYLQPEIDFSNQRIEKLGYYWGRQNSDSFTSDWVIYLGHTSKATFAHDRDWVPLTNLVKVFDGYVTLPGRSDNPWMEIELDTPFLYNNTDNLVIAVYKRSPEWWLCNFYNTLTPGQNRSIYYNDEWSDDPFPTATPWGDLATARPNTRIIMAPLPTAPILRVETPALNFGSIMCNCPSTPLNVTILNYGAGNLTLTQSDISFLGPNASEFSFDNSILPAAIEPMQRLQIPVYVTGLTEGEISATLRITYADEQHDIVLTAMVMPAGNIIIGSGSATQRHPFGVDYPSERSAAIYTADQIAGPGLIDMIAWNGATTSDRIIPYRIWARNTTATAMESVMWQSFVADLTLVKEGTFTANTTGWQEFQLDTPFAYTGGNLIIAVETNYGSNGYGNHSFRYTDSGVTMRHQLWRREVYNPEVSGELDSRVPNVMLHLASNQTADLAALSLSGNHLPAVGETSLYSLRIRNNSLQTLSNYTVKLIGPDETELFSGTGDPLNSLQSVDYQIPWTPTTTGTYAIHGKVELTADAFTDNNQTRPLQLTILPENNHTVTIGAGDELECHPMNFGSSNGLFETIYRADELGFDSGTITSITIYNNFSVDVGSKHTAIYLGSTDQLDLALSPIQASELTQVFDGYIDYPQGENAINIPLQTPYMYTGGNLVLFFHHTWDDPDYFHQNQFFKCQDMGSFRSRCVWGYDNLVDVNNINLGRPFNIAPQTTFSYTTGFVQNDLKALAITGNLTPTTGIATNYTFHLTNNGEATQSNYTLKLMDSNHIELASLAGPPISSQQSLEAVIPWTPPTPGPISIYGKIEFAADEAPINNCTASLDLEIKPTGVSEVTVGAGNEENSFPVITEVETSLFETLYYPDEMGGFTGLINALQFDNNFDFDMTDVPISIWLGTTTQNDLSGGWILPDELTLVFSGTVDFPFGTNIINIPLDEPYLYADGNNLVMLVYKDHPPTYYYQNLFKCQRSEKRRSLYKWTNFDPFEASSPPAGELTTLFPKTTFSVVPSAMGQICGTVTDANNQPLSGVSVSLDSGTIHTTTNDAGQYLLPHVLATTQTIRFNAHGYQEYTQEFALEANEQLIINVSMQLLPQVSVSGTVLANDTGCGHPNALIRLSGYESYQASTNSAGVFTIAGVFADQSYAYSITAPGYTSASGEVTVGSINHNLGTFTLEELGFAPVSVLAVENDADQVEVSWQAPDSGVQQISESFEGETFPPEGWTQISYNSALPHSDIYPTWNRAAAAHIGSFNIIPTDGNFQAGLTWSNYTLNEWLITPLINCQPNTWLTFDGYVYLGSPLGDNYFIKASTDGGASWTVLWDAAGQAAFWNQYTTPISIDLSDYSGTQLKIAFHAFSEVQLPGVRPAWFIDNVHIAAENSSLRSDTGALTGLPLRPSSRQAKDGGSKALIGYLVYRLKVNQEQDQAAWVSLNSEPTPALNFTDSAWADLTDGDYRWAVKTIYSGGLVSMPVLSNMLSKGEPMGTIEGTIKNENDEPIAGATVTNGTFTATTNSEGAYQLEAHTGVNVVIVSATGYETLIKSNVLVYRNLATIVNCVLPRDPHNDGSPPVVATALNGNYPNPFNPQTTISYSVKEPGQVKLQIYNIKGQLVRTLVDSEHAAGHYKQIFDARDDRDRRLASGVYLIRMQAPGYHKTSKMMLLK
jgi:hypothetical protein